MSPALRDSFVEYAPNTVRKVHALDAEALLLQRRLEDKSAHQVIRSTTVRQAKGRSRFSTIEATRGKHHGGGLAAAVLWGRGSCGTSWGGDADRPCRVIADMPTVRPSEGGD